MVVNEMLLTGSEIVIEILAQEGVKVVFGYPGGNVLPIYNSLALNKKGIRHILTSHEQGASHAADGYSRAGKGVGVVIATSGPGVTNIITGLATAFADSIPVVAITGSVPKKNIGTDSFQEVDTASLTLAATKHSFFVKDISKLAETLKSAFEIARSGRPGPVLIDIPSDVQNDKWEFEPLQEKHIEEYDDEIDTEHIEEAVELINKSQKPIIYCGGGAAKRNCGEIIKTLAEKTGAYITFSMMGLSAISAKEERYLGMAGLYGRMSASKAMAVSDLIIAAGARFSDRGTGRKEKFAPNAKIIHIDIDEAEHGKVVKADIEITGDVKKALELMTKKAEENKRAAWQKEIEGIKKEYAEKDNDPFSPLKIITKINEMTSPDTPVATDVGQHQMWVSKYYDFKKPNTYLTSGGFGTMGYGMGAAIGAALAVNGRSVLFTGDGSFSMNFNEVATAVRYNIPVTVVVLNNSGLGMIRQLQDSFWQGTRFSTELERKTDFAKIAKAMGAEGYRAENMEELINAYSEILKTNKTAVIDCIISDEEMALPMIPPGGAIEDIIK